MPRSVSTPVFSTIATWSLVTRIARRAPSMNSCLSCADSGLNAEGDIVTAIDVNAWLVMVRYFWTWPNLLLMIAPIGFSWPSTTPCCSAVNTSGSAIGVGNAPSWRQTIRWVWFSIVRSLRPRRSSGVDTGFLAVGELAKAVAAQRETDQTVGGKLREHLLPDRAFQDAIRVVDVTEQERDVEDLHLGYEIADHRGGRHGDVDRADLEALEHLALAAQRAPGMQPDLEAAIAALLDVVGERLRADALGRGRSSDVAEVEHLRRRLREADGRSGRGERRMRA